MSQMFGFEAALHILKAGGEVSRLAWGTYGNNIRLAYIEVDHLRRVPRFILIAPNGNENLWEPQIHDMLSDDWLVSKFPPSQSLPNNVVSLHAPRGPNMHRRKTDTPEEQP